MGAVPEGVRPERTLAERVQTEGYAYAFHNLKIDGVFTPPPGTEAIALGLPDPLVPTMQFFVYNPVRLEVQVAEPDENGQYFHAMAREGGYEMTGGIDRIVVFRIRR